MRLRNVSLSIIKVRRENLTASREFKQRLGSQSRALGTLDVHLFIRPRGGWGGSGRGLVGWGWLGLVWLVECKNAWIGWWPETRKIVDTCIRKVAKREIKLAEAKGNAVKPKPSKTMANPRRSVQSKQNNRTALLMAERSKRTMGACSRSGSMVLSLG